MASSWTCQRVSQGVACKTRNAGRLQKCRTCGKRKPARRLSPHDQLLAELDYAAFIALNGGEFCGICGTPPVGGETLHRDASHGQDAIPRGLLHGNCNRALNAPRQFGIVVTPEWLRAAADYLERAERLRLVA